VQRNEDTSAILSEKGPAQSQSQMKVNLMKIMEPRSFFLTEHKGHYLEETTTALI
jgi:hypothetical protein